MVLFKPKCLHGRLKDGSLLNPCVVYLFPSTAGMENSGGCVVGDETKVAVILQKVQCSEFLTTVMLLDLTLSTWVD